MPFPSQARTTESGKHLPFPTIVSIPITFRSDWLIAAASLSGKALHTALAIAYLSSKQNVAGVRVTRRTMSQFNISREAFYDSIKRLESKKLVSVFRLPGRSMHIVLTEFDSDKMLNITNNVYRH